MNAYVESHLNTDTQDGIGKIYSNSVENENVKIDSVGVKLSTNRALLLSIGRGTVLPVTGEYKQKTLPMADELTYAPTLMRDGTRTEKDVYAKGIDTDFEHSYFPYDSDFPFSANATAEDRERAVYRYITEKYAKIRQSFMLDVVSHNSQGMIQFGNAKDTAGSIHMNPSDPTLGSIARQLSTFNAAKLSREVATVMFMDDELSLVLNTNEVNEAYSGKISYEILDTSFDYEKVLERIDLIKVPNQKSLVYAKVGEAYFIDRVLTEEFIEYAELMDITNDFPLGIDDDIIAASDKVLLNKQPISMVVTMDNGDKHKLDPFGVKKVTVGNIARVKTYKSSSARPSSATGSLNGLLYKERSSFIQSSVDGFYCEGGTTVYSLEASGAKTIGSGPYNILGYNISGFDFANATPIRIGETDEYFLRDNRSDLKIDGTGLFVKATSDLNFTEVDLGGVVGTPVLFGDIEIETHYDTRFGAPTRNKNFMYEHNFIVSNGSVSDVIGYAYPITFFRQKRLYTDLCTAVELYPNADDIVNSRNRYYVGEISKVQEGTSGILLVESAKNAAENTIRYGCKWFMGKKFEEEQVIVSFGQVSADTLDSIYGDHFLTSKIKEASFSKNKKKYRGSIENIDADFAVNWVVAKSASTGKYTMVFETEYRDEISSIFNGAASPDSECSNSMSKGNRVEAIGGGTCEADPDRVRSIAEKDMMEYSVYWKQTDGSIDPNGMVLKTAPVGGALGIRMLGMLSGSDSFTSEIAPGLSIFAVSVQDDTVARDVSIVSTNTVNYLGETLGEDLTSITVPSVGFSCVVNGNVVIDDIESPVVTQIKSTNKRGILFAWENYTLEATLEYVPANTNIIAKYVFAMGSSIIRDVESVYPDAALSTDTMYHVDALYRIDRKLDEDKYALMFLANTLYEEFGFKQNIVATWDESSGILIDDSLVVISKQNEAAGHSLKPTYMGLDPVDIVDYYAMTSVYYKNIPYVVGNDMRIDIAKRGIIKGFTHSDNTAADAAFAGGDEVLASELTVKALCTSMGSIETSPTNRTGSEITLRVSPKLFNMQGPWKNPVDYVSKEEKVILDDDLSYIVQPKSRIILDFKIGSGNFVDFSQEGRMFGKVYEIVDGYVHEEVVFDGKQSPLQKGDTAYKMVYVNHAGGNIALNRDILVDLDAFPTLGGYKENRELLEAMTSTREDGHSREMDARSVHVRFDTRYISESIRSYYERYARIPEAFTCDSLPMESVASGDSSVKTSQHKTKISRVYGDDLIQSEGMITLSFDNPTDVATQLSIAYANSKFFYRRGDAVGSYAMDEVYGLLQAELLFLGDEERSQGRIKLGSKLENTEDEV